MKLFDRAADFRPYLAMAGAAVAAFAALGLFAFTQPARKATTHRVPYTQQVTFGYRALAHAGPVYAGGTVVTGDPIFLQLVHRLSVTIDYRLRTPAPASVRGTDQAVLKLTGPTGWTRTISLSPTRRFTGPRARIRVSLNLTSLQTLLHRVQTLTGIAGSGYSVAVVTKVHVTGRVAGQPIDGTFAPQLGFRLAPRQLQPAGAPSTTGGAPQDGGLFAPSRRAHVVLASTGPNALTVAGAVISIHALRLTTVSGLPVALWCLVLLAVVYIRGQGYDESVRIRAKYGHVIVPVAAGQDLGWPPVDVGNFNALVRLAERGGQLILYSPDEAVDTYMVNDDGTVYRYQAQLPKVIWGEWSEVSETVTPHGSAAVTEAAA